MLAILFCNTIIAQNSFESERTFVIANLENDELKSTNYSHPNLSIESKISRTLKLNSKDFELMNPSVSNEIGKGWFLTYKFDTASYAGIYKEKLQLRGDKLLITESRNALMAIATNCNTVGFTNDNRNGKCTNKKDDSLESSITFRLFTSSN